MRYLKLTMLLIDCPYAKAENRLFGGAGAEKQF